MAQVKFSIGEAAEILNLSPKTIRHYHAIGLLPEPQRMENGYRIYGAAELRQLQTIRRLQGLGLTLKQIACILDSDEPDADLHRFLQQRDADLSDTIDQLQRQQARVRAVLRGDARDVTSGVSSRAILEARMRAAASGLTDALLAVEATMLDELDRYPQHPGYAEFWEQAVAALLKHLMPHEQQAMLWIERYLALRTRAEADLQVQAWLTELHSSPIAPLLLQTFSLPPSPVLPPDEHAQLERLAALLLHEHASPLQREFLAALMSGRGSR